MVLLPELLLAVTSLSLSFLDLVQKHFIQKALGYLVINFKRFMSCKVLKI